MRMFCLFLGMLIRTVIDVVGVDRGLLCCRCTIRNVALPVSLLYTSLTLLTQQSYDHLLWYYRNDGDIHYRSPSHLCMASAPL